MFKTNQLTISVYDDTITIVEDRVELLTLEPSAAKALANMILSAARLCENVTARP